MMKDELNRQDAEDTKNGQEIASTSPLLSDAELAALRDQQDTRMAFYKTAGPGFRESADTIDLLFGHIDAMQAEFNALVESADNLIDEKDARIKELETAIRDALENLPDGIVNRSPDWQHIAGVKVTLREVIAQADKANG